MGTPFGGALKKEIIFKKRKVLRELFQEGRDTRRALTCQSNAQQETGVIDFLQGLRRVFGDNIFFLGKVYGVRGR